LIVQVMQTWFVFI